MGALTLRSLPYELRGWDLEKGESLDPTDGFGSTTRIYINRDQVVQIEPDFNNNTFSVWLSDRGRQFFDGIFGTWSPIKQKKILTIKEKSLTDVFKHLIKSLYISDHCNNQKKATKYFIIVFENLSIEALSLLIAISNKYSFVRLKRAENLNAFNDLESDLQLNSVSKVLKLNASTMCLLISTNPRYEGFHLNINLRQRFLKGNFRCLLLGSTINLTFPAMTLGSSSMILKTMIDGNNFFCQDLKRSKSPIFIVNNNLLGRTDGKNIFNTLKMLNHSKVLYKSWNGINTLASSLTEVGIQVLLASFKFFSPKDLTDFSSLYFLNVGVNNIANLTRITKLKLLNYVLNIRKSELNKVFFDQNSSYNNNIKLYNSLIGNSNNNYFFLRNSMFYENEETFLNTEGLIKRSSKLIFGKKTKNSWQILRNLVKQFKINFNCLNIQENTLIDFNSSKISTFKNYTYFKYLAAQSITKMNFFLSIKNRAFVMSSNKFKLTAVKILSTKVKYWLDDFFNGSKDEYSQRSLILGSCSKILRSESTNFS